MKRVLTLMVVAFGLFWSQAAFASHFRYGTINWRVPNPGIAPLTVEFTVEQAWRAAAPACVDLDFGDGTFGNGCNSVTDIGTGVDANGQAYVVRRYVETHTYLLPGTYTASFSSCCRVSGLQNGSDASFRVESIVNLSLLNPNTGGPVSAAPAIISLQSGGLRTFAFPMQDPDLDPMSCRLATDGEVGFSPATPSVPGPDPDEQPSVVAVGSNVCQLSWNLVDAVAGQLYVVHYVVESTHNGVVSSTQVDLLVQVVNQPAPVCTGGGTFNVEAQTPFATNLTGTGTTNLTLSSIGAPSGSTFMPTGTQASPFVTTFAWTPTLADRGTTRVVTVNFTSTTNLVGSCFVTVIVPSCVGFGQACSAGVGACSAAGQTVCQGTNTVCNAVAGTPTTEICDAIDNDCDGTTNNGNPGSGVVCSSGLPGICAPGLTTCSSNAIACVPNVTPGSVAEVCGDGLDQDCDGQPDATDPSCPDTDGDGIIDAIEDQIGTDPLDADSDDDGVIDGDEPLFATDSDGDGLINALDPDSDNDGLLDGTEHGLDCSNPATDADVCVADGDAGATVTDPLDADTDGGGVNDGSEDANLNGVIDAGETDPTTGHGADDSTVVDTDGDGLSDALETFIGSNPNDADSDDDGIIDGSEANFALDTDGDGLINVLDRDSDNDALFDGLERGTDCTNPATAQAICRVDGDAGATRTSMLKRDTDDGGASDGSEDANLNGVIDAGETDPTTGHGADDSTVTDADGDGLSDALEATLGSNPNDADSDDDGVRDGLEANPSDDTDSDTKNNVTDEDSDGDGLFDGTETGLPCTDPATSAAAMHCIADADPTTKTNALDADTDDGGVRDGDEDSNHNGSIDAGETDPNDPIDDDNTDSDGDGLTNAVEVAIGTDPFDADSDDDGVLDGAEKLFDQDSDLDGDINALDIDSDDDGILDGTEVGSGCMSPDTTGNVCVADADPATTTDPTNKDTDGGTVEDGVEDANHNGRIDAGETDPNDPTDDVPGTGGAGGGAPSGGSSSGGSSSGGSSSGGSGGSGGDVDDGVFAEGNGIFCNMRPANDVNPWAVLGAVFGMTLLASRRRNRR